MTTATVTTSGTIQLGEQARALGFRPGAVVQIIAASSGSLILALSDTVPLEGQCLVLEEQEWPALGPGRRG